jgi:site-specific recombinase XerD
MTQKSDPYVRQHGAQDASDASRHEQQLLTRWLGHLRPQTQRGYTADLARLLRHCRKPLLDVTAADIADFVDFLLAEVAAGRMSAQTCQRIRRSISSWCSFAEKDGHGPA